MRYAIIFTISIFLLVSCKKDKYQTVPQLKYEGANTKGLHNGEVLTMTLSFTDAEGDLQDSLYVEKVVPRCFNSTFNKLYKLPEFPSSKNQKGEILVTFGYNVPGPVDIKGPRCNRNDTATFRFVLKDKAQNKSDTITSDPIIIYY